MAKLTYLSHAACLLETNGHKILMDPFLTGNPLAPVEPEDVECNFIILTHGHGDHVGDTVDIAKRNDATVIANYEIATWCGEQGLTAHPLHLGGGHDFPFGRVKLTIAHHGSGYQTDKGILYMGNPAGVLVTVEGKTLYHAGDTALFYDMKLIGEMNSIDLALLPIGDNFTMGIDDAVKATEFLNPKTVVPIHYKTFEVIDVDPNEFVEKARAKGFDAQVVDFGGDLTI
ncbi:metal-dependent hydrolase [candidate division KSB1 bacterium]|nr:metal-dependent hydrolase [candidate division KSB1 bacterium]NIR71381.1 metal-dependent hydrolase [candidate division KSB1 bacterium]NIS26275.1 metal-dependent hydrolase [candidate division KSB1 bacterium]NIT73037.1 metal-dependent hydrolase [candidate division KSB1 bacterium]NIU26945.1 metal-dependent hydrolase [candidate division KSB1 bacterium]